MRVHTTEMKTGISRSKDYEDKGLAAYVVNHGTKCDNDCLYCSTGAVMRMHSSHREAHENPFDAGYCIVDPGAPDRVARGARRMRNRGMVHICSLADAWSREALKHNIGRRCLEAILSQPDWTARILTKKCEVERDFDFIGQYRDRVSVGLSITATADKADVMSIVEPYASPNPERMAVLREAHERGLRTYGMLCPLLPGIADDPKEIDKLVRFVVDCGAEEIFAEPVNARGRGLKLTQGALAAHGYEAEAAAVGSIRNQKNWSAYAARLVFNVQRSVRRNYDIRRLRFLLYAAYVRPEDAKQIMRDDAGVIWLEKD